MCGRCFSVSYDEKKRENIPNKITTRMKGGGEYIIMVTLESNVLCFNPLHNAIAHLSSMTDTHKENC